MCSIECSPPWRSPGQKSRRPWRHTATNASPSAFGHTDRNRGMMKRALLAAVLMLVPPASLHAYDVPTHREIGQRAAEAASGLHDVLIRDLALPDGRRSLLRAGGAELSAAGWIREGAGEEDRPFWRVRHHFQIPWRRGTWPVSRSTRRTRACSSHVVDPAEPAGLPGRTEGRRDVELAVREAAVPRRAHGADARRA